MNRKNALLVVLSLFTTFLTAQTSFEIALEHLRNSEEYQPNDLAEIQVSDEYQSRHNGITHLYLKQNYKGIEVKGALTNFNIKSGMISSAGGTFVTKLGQKVNTTSPEVNAVQALQAVMQAHQIAGEIPPVLKVSRKGDRSTVFEKGDIALENIQVRLVYLTRENVLKLCWEVSLYEKSAENWWVAFVDVQNGEILEEHNHVIHCAFHSGRKGNSLKSEVKHLAEITLKKNAIIVANSYRVYAPPVESPNHGARTLEVSPWDLAGDAGTLGWHDDGTTTYTHSKGNNADAYNDQNNSNGPTGGNAARADGGANLEFDFDIDFSVDPESDPDPYIANLFYWNNIMHDIWYQYGFDEPSGNFQEDNLGRGGAGSDYVRAEGQDGGGTNNANFSTPTDGGNPRMQMYLWDPAGEFLLVNAPGSVAGLYDMRQAAFGGSIDTPLTGDVVEADDGSTNPALACDPLVNGGEIAGKIALIDRGTCQFGTKCLNAQNAGAIAVIVCNNVSGLITMGAGNDGNQVTIPAVMIRQSDCTTLRAELGNGLNVTMEGSGNINVDGDLDNGIIAHEYGHGISIRLTGGPSTSSCLNNAEQMGEGWSDFFGIWMTIEPGDNHADSRGVGTYALGEGTNDTGIRPAPYSTSFSLNDYTYGNVDDGNISQPHGVGFIWCTMLWDLNWAMVNAHGLDLDLYNGTGGNNITAQLVMDGLKGQPCSPGFVDGRDAILQADQDNNGGDNEDIIWNVFARRGLGFSASQGSSGSRFDQTEAFDLPPGVAVIPEDELFDAGPLPVEMTNFMAVANDDKQLIELYWSTASETNNKGFDVQRRSEESSVFETITWLDGKSEANDLSNYSYSDKNVKSGIEYYYRLRQLDFDNSENLSEVVHARLKGNAAEIQVFPNPTEGFSTVQFSSEIAGQVNMQILNAQGQIIGVSIFETNGNAELEVDLSQQPEGVYFLKFEIGQEQFVKRMVLKK